MTKCHIHLECSESVEKYLIPFSELLKGGIYRIPDNFLQSPDISLKTTCLRKGISRLFPNWAILGPGKNLTFRRSDHSYHFAFVSEYIK